MRFLWIPGVWGLGLVTVAAAGFRPDPYLEHVVQIPPPHPYPVATVLWVSLFMTAQCAFVVAIVRPRSYHHSWARSLVASLLSLGCFLFSATFGMHAPPAYAMYLLWSLLMTVGLFSVFLWSACHALWPRLRRP